VRLSSTLNYCDSEFPRLIAQLKGLIRKKRVERKIGSGTKCAFSSSTVRAALKAQTAGRSVKSYHELGWKITTLAKSIFNDGSPPQSPLLFFWLLKCSKKNLRK
jgi:hypothetical protein